MKWSANATVLAPISWGTTYVTITELLPQGRPLFVAAMRVVPAGLVLLAVGSRRRASRPRGAMWWQTGVLALANFGVFFPLLAIAVYRLPGGVAASVGGLQPLFVAALSRVVAGTRPRRRDVAVGVAAAVGVALVVLRPGAGLDGVGILAAVGANVSFALGVVLTKRFPAPSNKLAATGWQLVMSGVLLAVLATAVEGAPPALSGANVGRLRLPEPDRHGARLPAVVQRHPAPAGGSAAPARAGGTDHRRDVGMGRPRPTALDSAARRLRRHARRHRVRSGARRLRFRASGRRRPRAVGR